jgi:CRP/FNR family transcriptional regulator, anaerobic regulatory protein
MDRTELAKLLPGTESALLDAILKESAELSVPAGQTLLKPGSYVHAVPLVVQGMVRVSRVDQDKELLLYYIHPGEMCIMSFSACCNSSSSMIEAYTLEETTLLMMPSAALRGWIQEYPAFSYLVFGMFSLRYTDLIDTIDQLIFNRMDERLLKYLRERARMNNNQSLQLTHQQIATEMGTAREVISRILKKLESENKISLARTQITLL